MTRRDFITQSALATVGSTLAVNTLAAAATSHPVRLGGPIFTKASDPEELAQAHVDLGYRAAYCPGVSLKETDRIRAFSEAFSRKNVVIAEVGRWVNLMDRNPEKQKANLAQVTEGLALADEIGALCCVDIAGSRSPVEWYGPHPENLGKDYFDAAVRNARAIIDAVKPKRAKFCYEVMGWALPDGPDTYLKAAESDR
jgi:sugar phosphate isomerase/epimerase